MDITEVVRVVMEQIKEAVRSETVIGAPVESADAVIIPVSRVAFGFGAGGGERGDVNKQSGMGTGCGVAIEPVAFVVVSHGKAQLLPLKSREATLSRIVDLIPDVLELFSKKGDEQEEEESC
ncbi:MAG: GerW family sporulation protein [Candidatus Latescibacterota bacterium]